MSEHSAGVANNSSLDKPLPSKQTWILLLGILMFSCVLRVPLAHMPLERDEGEYAYIAWRWNVGEVPYIHSFNQKFPLVFLIYRVILRYVGETPSAIHWAMQFWVLLVLLAIFALGRRLFSDQVGLIAAAFSAVLLPDITVYGQSANTEIFLILPATLGFLFTLNALREKSWAFSVAAGICLSATTLCKQTAILYLLVAGATIAINSGTWSLLLGFVIGASMPFVLLIKYFYSVGGLRALWDCTVLYNWQYTQANAYRTYWWNLWQWLQLHLRNFWIVDVLALRFLFDAIGSVFSKKRGMDRQSMTFLLIWFVLSCMAISAGGFFRPHYFTMMIPSLSLMTAQQIVQIPWRHLLPKIGPRRAFVTLFIVQALSMQGKWWYYFPFLSKVDPTVYMYDTVRFVGAKAIADLINRQTNPKDAVFIFGHEPEILFYAKRISASRYIYLFPLMIPSRSALDRQYELMNELRANNPKMVVTFFQPREKELNGGPTYMFDALKHFLSEDGYHVQALAISNERDGYDFITGPDAAEAWKKGISWPDDWLATYKVVLWSR